MYFKLNFDETIWQFYALKCWKDFHKNETRSRIDKSIIVQGSGCGTGGRGVASDTRDRGFKSSHQNI